MRICNRKIKNNNTQVQVEILDGKKKSLADEEKIHYISKMSPRYESFALPLRIIY